MRTRTLLSTVLAGAFASPRVAAEFGGHSFSGPSKPDPTPHTVSYAPPEAPSSEWTTYHQSTYVAPPPHSAPYTQTVPPYHPESTTCTTYPEPSPTLPSLEDALINAGASKFLAFIKEDADIWALYNSPRVRTVFAPGDAYITNSSLVRRDLSPEEQVAAELSADLEQTDLSVLRLIPGTVVETNAAGNLNGAPQVIVSDSSDSNAVKLTSGLGDQVEVKTSDIQYQGGLIQVTDGLLTPPKLLSETALQNSQTQTFAQLLTNPSGSSPTNVTRRQAVALDFQPEITVFIPVDDAFNALGSAPNAGQVLSGHVVSSGSLGQPVGYLPSLKNGDVLTAQSGKTLSITVQGLDYFVNGAKIVKRDLVLENGVAHLISQVLTPPIVTGGAARSGVGGLMVWAVAAGAAFVLSFF